MPEGAGGAPGARQRVIVLVGLPGSGKSTYLERAGAPSLSSDAIRKLLAMGFYENHIWLALERRMKCGIGLCGNCQIDGLYLCQRGPLVSYREVSHLKEAV